MLTYSEGNPSITAKTFTLEGEVQTGTMQMSQFHMYFKKGTDFLSKILPELSSLTF